MAYKKTTETRLTYDDKCNIVGSVTTVTEEHDGPPLPAVLPPPVHVDPINVRPLPGTTTWPSTIRCSKTFDGVLVN